MGRGMWHRYHTEALRDAGHRKAARASGVRPVESGISMSSESNWLVEIRWRNSSVCPAHARGSMIW